MGPSETPVSPEDLPILLADDDFVKVAAIDIDGVLRGKLISKSKFLSLFDNKKDTQGDFGFCGGLFGWDIQDLFYTSEYSNRQNGYPDLTARVDLSTFRRIPWENNRPFFLLHILDPITREDVPVSPRSVIKRVAEKADALGFKAFAGVEYEFVSFRLPDKANEPSKKHTIQSYLKEFAPSTLPTVFEGVNVYGLTKSMGYESYFSSILENCTKFNVPIEGFHTELGPGMYEAAIAYAEITEVADKASLFKHTVKATAASFGDIQPCFMAKPRPGSQGMSGHCHVSLVDKKTGKNAFGRDEEDKAASHKDVAWLSDVGRSFLAGILQALPDIMPVLAPNINSYKRLVENYAAPVTVSWAYESRLGSVRLITPPATSAAATRLEVRVPGADSNPHLALAAIVAAGLRGIEEKLDLFSAPGCPPPLSATVENNDWSLPIPGDRLARTLEEATNVFRKSKVAEALFGRKFVEHFAYTRDQEISQWYEAITDWEFARYGEHI